MINPNRSYQQLPRDRSLDNIVKQPHLTSRHLGNTVRLDNPKWTQSFEDQTERRRNHIRSLSPHYGRR